MDPLLVPQYLYLNESLILKKKETSFLRRQQFSFISIQFSKFNIQLLLYFPTNQPLSAMTINYSLSSKMSIQAYYQVSIASATNNPSRMIYSTILRDDSQYHSFQTGFLTSYVDSLANLIFLL